MEKFDRYKIDFHSLRVLQLVHRLRSVSEAAEALELNQSSVSYTLERLRKAFGEPLFVRIGRGIEPTAHCNDLMPQLQNMLALYEQMTQPSSFDPQTAQDRFVIAGNFYERSIIFPRLVHRMRQSAPGVRLAFLQANTDGDTLLEQGLADILVSPIQGKSSGFYRKKLIDETYACFVDPAHPAARSGLTLRDYASARHLQVNYANGWRPYYFNVLTRLGISIEPSVELPSFGAIEHVVAGTDLIVTAAAGLDKIFKPFLVAIPPPFDCSFPIYMSWTGRTHASSGHRWLRNMVTKICDEVL